MKHEWRKSEKSIYFPKTQPELIDVPEFQYIGLNGEGNPNSEFFSICIEALYSVSYAIKMNLKKVEKPPYAVGKNLKRKDKIHCEIYLSDFRKVPADKLKTILRFQVNES